MHVTRSNPGHCAGAVESKPRRAGLVVLGVLLVLGLVSIRAAADDSAPEPAAAYAYKLTLGYYDFSDHSHGEDLNLRYSGDAGNFWLGDFRLAAQDVNQWRTGWDQTFGSAIRLSPSLQFASGGFAGGSFGLESGENWFAGAGLGRTNLRPYWNLNFDPNDAWTVDLGHHGEGGDTATLLWVRDNRQNPDQRHLHLMYRQPLAAGHRLTIDLLHKQGLVDGELIRRWGLTVTYDWPRFFIRLADDPKTNFTAVDAWRLAIGTRF